MWRRARTSPCCSGASATGLENDEVALADRIITFPVNPAFASLNLAQAVALIAYEWFKLATGGALPFAMPQKSEPARKEQVAGLLRQSRARARPDRVFPAAAQARDHAGQSAQHLRAHAADPAGRADPAWHRHGAVEGRKGPARGGVLDGEEAKALRALLAEHGGGRVPGERGPVRGLSRLLRRNPTEAERALWDALTNDRRFAGKGFKRQVPVGPHITDFVSFPLRLVIDLVPAGRARPPPRRAPIAAPGSCERGYRVLDVPARGGNRPAAGPRSAGAGHVVEAASERRAARNVAAVMGRAPRSVPRDCW